MRRWGILAVLVTAVALGSATWTRAELAAPGRPAPEFATGPWINSDPLTMSGLRGRVVLIDFWTFG
jgi:hypothetical protein